MEDNLANLDVVETIFGDRPEIALISALQGRLGLQLAREHRPDLVLLNLHLPDVNGEMVLHERRADERTRHIPVLVISADATTRQIERLRAAGCATTSPSRWTWTSSSPPSTPRWTWRAERCRGGLVRQSLISGTGSVVLPIRVLLFLEKRSMKITTKGQVTVPRHIRDELGLLPHTDVEWELRDGVAVLQKATTGDQRRGRSLVEHMRGRGTVKMTTDEIMVLTRGDA